MIKIMVGGLAKDGKSTISAIIAEALTKHNIRCEILNEDDDPGTDHTKGIPNLSSRSQINPIKIEQVHFYRDAIVSA